MAQQIIPLDSAPNQTFKVAVNVDGKLIPLAVVLRYNEPANYWAMTLSDGAGNLLLDSIPFVTGLFPAANILGQYAYLGIGSALVANASGVGSPDYPNNQDLGNDFILVWEDTAA